MMMYDWLICFIIPVTQDCIFHLGADSWFIFLRIIKSQKSTVVQLMYWGEKNIIVYSLTLNPNPNPLTVKWVFAGKYFTFSQVMM